MLNLLSLSQLEHKARTEDNLLALAILEKLDEEIEESVEQALEDAKPDDADYSYEVFDAVQAVEFLMYEAAWYKLEETRNTKDLLIYMIQGLHEDTSPCNNSVKLSKFKGSEQWQWEAKAGQYGENVGRGNFAAKGFKEAQELCTKAVIKAIRQGLELNI
jgi:hypothetical protein